MLAAAGIWRGMGLALEKVDELDNARRALTEACEREPEYGLSWVNLGAVLLKQDRGAEALAAGRKAVALIREEPGGYVWHRRPCADAAAGL